MKIALISFGHVDVVLSLAKYMAAHIDVDVYLVFSQPFKIESIINFSDLAVADGFLEEHVVNKILGDESLGYIEGKLNVNIFIYRNLKLRDMRNIISSYRLAKCLLGKNYDLVHFNGNSIFQLFISFFLGKIPRVHTIHDFILHRGEKKNLAVRLKLPERLNRYLAKSSRHTIVHSNSIKNLIFKSVKSARNIHAIYYGPLDIYTFFKSHGANPLRSPYILFFGRIAEYKGISYLIDAFNKVRDKFEDIKLVIAGSGNVNCVMDRLSGNSNIILMNRYINNRELADLIHHSLMVVCPYIDASQSGVVQTAYAFFKPVIATDVGGLPEVVDTGVTGKLIPAFDSIALAGAMEELLSNKEKLAEMAGNIRYRLKKELRWEYIAKQTIGVYKKALKGVR